MYPILSDIILLFIHAIIDTGELLNLKNQDEQHIIKYLIAHRRIIPRERKLRVPAQGTFENLARACN